MTVERHCDYVTDDGTCNRPADISDRVILSSEGRHYDHLDLCPEHRNAIEDQLDLRDS
jgi:hypothetical protein